MNLLSIVPLPWRILAVCGLLLASLLVGWVLGIKHEEVKFDAYKAAEAQQSLKIQTETIAKTAQLQKQKDEATNAANERAKQAQADADAAHAAGDGLRSDLADARAKLSSASADAVRKYAATLGAVFGECSQALERLGIKAQGHASDTLTLEQSWPK